MNCRNFEAHITELARGQMLEADVRKSALAHLEECKRCQTRLANEQSLSMGLNAVATRAASVEAPRQVEATLLAAFRQRTASPFVPSVAPAQTPKRQWSHWSLAAAAVLLVVSAFAVLRLLSGSAEPIQQASEASLPAPLSSPGFIKEPKVESPMRPSPVVVDGGQRFVGAPSSRGNRQRPLMRDARFDGERSGLANDAAMSNRPNEEITTEFIPLSYGSNLSQLDGGQVVRVELPRSALQSFGLPVNAERAGERVKADVLLGHDGVAHAIRFVR